jgi:hypothetical protein
VLGRSNQLDRSTGALDRPGYDHIGKFGAGALYGDIVAFAYTDAPQNSKVSNKESEHFIGNMPVRIVIAQLAGQTQPRNLKTLVSQRIVLRPGNQSLGGT